ncbi:MAG: hypothetical protein GEU83_15595 [Pseudonocardiaceae bacterium]|nr:hypothetical protein [Pseudonocardiaceae bacterium]
MADVTGDGSIRWASAPPTDRAHTLTEDATEVIGGVIGCGHRIPDAADARPVVLVRYRPDVTGQASRTVHVVPHPGAVAPAAAVSALCGALLVCEQIETVTPGQGMPCTMCLLLRSSTTQPSQRCPPNPSQRAATARHPRH